MNPESGDAPKLKGPYLGKILSLEPIQVDNPALFNPKTMVPETLFIFLLGKIWQDKPVIVQRIAIMAFSFEEARSKYDDQVEQKNISHLYTVLDVIPTGVTQVFQ